MTAPDDIKTGGRIIFFTDAGFFDAFKRMNKTPIAIAAAPIVDKIT
jgi:hypothetical protein